MTDTYICGGQRRKFFLISGEFTTTVKASLDADFALPALWSNTTDVTGDDTNTAGCDRTTDNIIWFSGQFTTTLKSSLYVGTWRANVHGLTCDDTNTGSGGLSFLKVTTWSGKVTSTIKDSHFMSIGVPGVSWEVEETMWNVATKLYLMSGRYTSTTKTSQDISAFETNCGGVSWNFTDIIFCGEGTGDLIQKMSGRFTSTIKTTLDFTIKDSNPRGIESADMAQRMGPTAGPSDIEVSPLTIDFEDVFITTSESNNVTISNLGDQFLTVTQVGVTNSVYTIAGLSTHPAGNVKAFSVPPAGSTVFSVIFTPLTTDVELGWLNIVNDSPGEELVQVFLTGYGTLFPPLEGTQNFTLYIDQQKIQDRYISQGRSFTGYVEQARNFDLEL